MLAFSVTGPGWCGASGLAVQALGAFEGEAAQLHAAQDAGEGEPSDFADQDLLVGHWGVTTYLSEDGESDETNPDTFYADFNADGTASITSAGTTVFYTWSFAVDGHDDNGLTRSYILKQADETGEELFVSIGAEEGAGTYGLGVIGSSEEDSSEMIGITKLS